MYKVIKVIKNAIDAIIAPRTVAVLIKSSFSLLKLIVKTIPTNNKNKEAVAF